MQEKLLTTAEAADLLGVTTRRIRQLVRNGEIEGQKVGRDLLIPARAIEAAKLRKTKPGPAPQRLSKESQGQGASADSISTLGDDPAKKSASSRKSKTKGEKRLRQPEARKKIEERIRKVTKSSKTRGNTGKR